jgi:Peptidase family M23
MNMFTKTIMAVVILTPLASVAFGAGAVESCNYHSETKANSELILAALGNDAEQCVTFPYLASYSKPEPVMPWYHAGVDLRAKYQAAYALVDGTVVVDCGRGQKEEDTACTDSMGIVMIETEINGSKARVSYVHMSQSFVTNGMRVAAGKTKVGTTGNRFNFDPNGAGEPHLHIEVRPGYQGTSAVGFTSCHPDDRCDTKEKVQAITMNPMQLVQSQATDVRNAEYVVSAKISNNEHEMQVFINNNQIYFKDNTPKKNCNEGQFSWKEYEASSTQEIKMGDKIVSNGLENKGIKQYVDGQFDFKMAGYTIADLIGQKTVIVTKNAGQALLELQYLGSKKSKYCNIKYSIPFIVTK